MKALTVFTPTFNRAHLLERLYQSLLRQTCGSFCWLVVDDGSVDETRRLVDGWIADGAIEIRYVYKSNGGMHTAHNLAYDLIQTELNTCIDSDDWMPDDAVAKILSCWQLVREDESLAGIVGLDQSTSGNLIGSRLPRDGTRCTLGKLYEQLGIVGDKKLVYRSSVTGSFPRYPEYQGERLVPLSFLYTLIDRKYEIACFNEVFAIVDYQVSGSSATIVQQYFESPRGFRDARIVSIKYGTGLFVRLRSVVHFGVESLIIGEGDFVRKSPVPVLSLLLMPLSIAAYLYLRWRYRRSISRSRA